MRSLAVCLVFFVMSCSSRPVPKEVIVPEQMQKIVHDLMQVDEYINNFLIKDTTIDIKKKRSVLYEQVFLLHKTNRKEFFTSFDYYKQHPALQKSLFDSLYNKLSIVKEDTVKPKLLKPVEVK
jgi:hypothetical protein